MPHFFHKYDKWRAVEHFIDISWGDRQPCTTMMRRCTYCGNVKTKTIYGAFLRKDL